MPASPTTRASSPAQRCDRSRRSKRCAEGSALTRTATIVGTEPPPFELIEGAADSRVILVCDHASNRFPAAFGTLGVPDYYLDRHIAWDIGAGAVTRRLRERLGCPAILANYSRLLIDLNRRTGDASAMPQISDGVLVPGNLGLSDEARAARVREFHEPYHAAIEDLIESRIARLGSGEGMAKRAAAEGVAQRASAARMPVFIGIHSFTPRYCGADRPWHAGVLWDRDPRLAVPLLERLRAVAGLVIGDNEPYSGRHTADYSIDRHAETRGMAHAGIELRQDLIGDAAGQARWAGLLGDALEGILADEALFEPLSAVNPIE